MILGFLLAVAGRAPDNRPAVSIATDDPANLSMSRLVNREFDFVIDRFALSLSNDRWGLHRLADYMD